MCNLPFRWSIKWNSSSFEAFWTNSIFFKYTQWNFASLLIEVLVLFKLEIKRKVWTFFFGIEKFGKVKRLDMSNIKFGKRSEFKTGNGFLIFRYLQNLKHNLNKNIVNQKIIGLITPEILRSGWLHKNVSIFSSFQTKKEFQYLKTYSKRIVFWESLFSFSKFKFFKF